MSFMDKVKAQAEQAVSKGQDAVAQGQTKLNEMQAAKAHDALLRELGAAYYAQQRSGGSADAVTKALAALDAEDAPPAPPPAASTPETPAGPSA